MSSFLAPELLKRGKVMSTTPPPLPPISRGSNAFANGAALACLLSPLLLLALRFGFQYLSPALGAGNLIIGGLVFLGVSCLLLVAGPIMGILALLLMKPGGRTRIMVCSLGGLALTGVLVAVSVPQYVRARSATLAQKAAMDNMIAASKDLKANAAEALKTNGPSASVARVNQALDQAAKAATGDEGLALKGSQAYLARLQEVQQAYQAASSKLQSARVLCTSNLVSREDIQGRKAVVQNFLKCNEAVKNFTIHSEDNYRAELVRLNVSPAFLESAAEGFHRSSAPQVPLVVEIRAQDERIGDGMLAVLDLLDANWGHWSYNADSGRLRFETQDLVEQYDSDLRGINEAGLEQMASQKRLATVMSQASLR
jgi:hypothetical protein